MENVPTSKVQSPQTIRQMVSLCFDNNLTCGTICKSDRGDGSFDDDHMQTRVGSQPPVNSQKSSLIISSLF